MWSPCSRFFAVGRRPYDKWGVQILDAVTLKQLGFFPYPDGTPRRFTFSPDGRSLMWIGSNQGTFAHWDLQTGVLVGATSVETWEASPREGPRSVTYSGCGTMFGILFANTYDGTAIINTYKTLSHTPIHHHRLHGQIPVDDIWTHNKCLQYATFGPGSVTIWELAFAPGPEQLPTEVESLPTPDNFSPSNQFLYHPPSSRLAFVTNGNLFVWDARHSKFLLTNMEKAPHWYISFSHDGRFFTCGYQGPHALWEETPTGYTLRKLLLCSTSVPRFSPNGQLVVVTSSGTIQLWPTTYPATPPSHVPTRGIYREPFLLQFSPDGSLAATARVADSMVTVLDTQAKSRVPRLIIDTSMKVYGLRAEGSTIVVVGDEKIVTWNLPSKDCALGSRVSLDDSIQTTALDLSVTSGWRGFPPLAFISPDFRYVVINGERKKQPVEGDKYTYLSIHDVSTGKYLEGTAAYHNADSYFRAWIISDQHNVWLFSFCQTSGRWEITKDSEPNHPSQILLEHSPIKWIEDDPWQPSSSNYKVMEDGWIYGLGKRRLLWLPPNWRADQDAQTYRVWAKQFLGLVHQQLEEVVVLEFLKE